MNYATLLALLATMAFALPFLVRLGQNAGVPRVTGIILTLAIIVFLGTWLWLRWRIAQGEEADSSLTISAEMASKQPGDITQED